MGKKTISPNKADAVVSVRFTPTMTTQLDSMIQEGYYLSRSDAIRSIVRERLSIETR